MAQIPHYAAGYYPLVQKKEDWERDIKHMKECKISLIRTAELFCSWDQLEPEEEKYEFQWLDEFFDLCEKYDMKILLGTGTASPPYWIYKKYPDVCIENNHGEQYPMNASYSWACFDHLGFRKEAQRYISTLVQRYQNHKALYAYQIHNEIAFPFMPLGGTGVDVYCYNEPSCEKFRSWLKVKYKEIEVLNEAYCWGATHTRHNSFEEVNPPKALPSAWASVTRWLDWRLFWMENTVDYVKWQNDLIKKYDTHHLTTTNIFFLKSQDPFGVLTGLDQFEMAKVVDVIGYDIYPGSGNKVETMPEFSSMCLDMGRSTALAAGKDYWLLETESGPINGWVLGPSRNVTGQDLYRNVLDAFSHGSKVSLYQGFREWDFQPIHWGGLVDLDGNPTKRLESAAEIGNLLKAMEDTIEEGQAPKAKIAIAISRENAIILKGMDQEKFLHKALRGAYRTFWEKYQEVDFICQDMIKKDILEAYQIIYLPFFSYVTEKMAEELTQYVKQGGILIGTARLGMLGEHGWYNHQMPCFSLGKVFGIDAREVISNVTPNITYRRKEYKGYWHQELLKITEPKVEVLARFSDDLPAVTQNNYGKGKAIYFGTHPDVAYLEEKSYLLWDILDEVLSKAKIVPQVELFFSQQHVREFDGSLLLGEEKGYLIITSSFTEKYSYSSNKNRLVQAVIRTPKKVVGLYGMISKETYPSIQREEECTFELHIEKNECEIVCITFENGR
ncbi:MAG: beta-galactosidase [Lachnospiraceae bacterium]